MRLAALLILVLGCGGIEYEDFLDEQRDATCGYYVRCGSFTTAAECRTYFQQFASSNSSFRAAVDAGKVFYSTDAAEDCIDALEDLDCDFADQDADALLSCDYVFTGTLELGSACAFDGECESDRCMVPSCDEACCIGACAEPRSYPGIDEPCTTVCADDLYCGFDQICHAPADVGEECDSYVVCAQPFYCSPTSRVCSARPQRGEPCDGVCATEGLVCNADGICVEGALGGEPCATELDCARYYRCNAEVVPAPVCELAPVSGGELPNGETCMFSSQCSSLYCDTVCADEPLCF